MRILDPSSATLGIEALGYEPEQREALLHAIGRPYGIRCLSPGRRAGETGVAVHLPAEYHPTNPESTFPPPKIRRKSILPGIKPGQRE